MFIGRNTIPSKIGQPAKLTIKTNVYINWIIKYILWDMDQVEPGAFSEYDKKFKPGQKLYKPEYLAILIDKTLRYFKGEKILKTKGDQQECIAYLLQLAGILKEDKIPTERQVQNILKEYFPDRIK